VLVAGFVLMLEDHRCHAHGVFDRADDQALAQLGGTLVAKGNDR
jgi:hypothetical protein